MSVDSSSPDLEFELTQELADLLEVLEESDPESREALLMTLEPDERLELSQALEIHDLLKNLEPIKPPASLPLQTARRARQRLRAQQVESSQRFDLLIMIAIVVLIFSIIILIIGYREQQSQPRNLKVIKMQPLKPLKPLKPSSTPSNQSQKKIP